MKSLYIRCSEETYKLAHSLAKHEDRSLNKQIIHMIHSLAKEKGIEKLLDTYNEVLDKHLPDTEEMKQGNRRVISNKPVMH